MDRSTLEAHLLTTRESVQRIQRRYVELFHDCAPVIDLGCGPGYFLELLRTAGIAARGVDADAAQVAAAAAEGLAVEGADLLEFMQAAAPASAGGVFCAHVVEHLPASGAERLVAGCHRLLAPGGTIVLVTPNSRALYSHLEYFHAHPGHVRFYHPDLLSHMLLSVGFRIAGIGENPPGQPFFGDRLPRIRQLAEELGRPRPMAGVAGPGGLRRAIRRRVLAWVAPWIDQLSLEIAEVGTFAADVAERLDRPPEVYVIGKK
ncbi:MAG: methyltransferase domain-containing protein [Candidatus Wallbacteria bacterium]|nr:methyltransferase domain-containing protein [Candidatus Wallbacteria bacterium]